MPGRNYKRKTARIYKPYGSLKDKDMEAFEVFFVARKFKEVAKKFSVSLPTVSKHAEKNQWFSRLVDRSAKIQAKTDEKLSEKLARDRVRQYDVASLVEINAGNFLNLPGLKNGDRVEAEDNMLTARALKMAVETKHLIVGEPTQNLNMTFKDYMLILHKDAGLISQ